MVTRRDATKVLWPRSRHRGYGATPMLVTRIGLMAVVLAVAVTAGAAPPYDGSKPLQCAISTVMVCSDPSVCVRGTAATINLPPVLNVDVGQKLISGAATGRTIKITSVEHEGGRLLMSGTESGGSWNLAVVEDSGAMSSVVLVRDGGFLMFGTCTSN
jgi:hypothetical protein